MAATKKKDITPEQIIKQHVDQALAELNSAIEIADNYGIEFYFQPAYGMGGRYKPITRKYTKDELLKMIADGSFANLNYKTRQSAIEVLSGSREQTGWEESTAEGTWISSSSNC